MFGTRRPGESGLGSCTSPQPACWPGPAQSYSDGQPSLALATLHEPESLLSEAEEHSPIAGVQRCSFGSLSLQKFSTITISIITVFHAFPAKRGEELLQTSCR
jgi:hypothetical protein